ncbi:glycoside hydrolase family 3 protein [Kutzneria kofuensis]|uniref:glycoside hydrolase family 3 protein n=1 Tax=Kutzneria kofuensis TaxID=103725 RepID=UPI0031EE151B
MALPSPTALAACWDPELARSVGRLLAQEARRKGVHVLLAPTVNLHRTPLGGRHFECYSEDPLLTGLVGAGYVRGVQDGGVATTVKHFVANDSETQRYTVDVRADDRTLRELYLAPFEIIVKQARPWGVMAAYNSVNGATMTEHGPLQKDLRDEWGFDGFIVSDWTATRHTERAALGGLDVAMPGPITPFGPDLAQAVRDGRVPEEAVDAMVRRVLLLAARVGILDGFEPAVATLPEPIAGDGLACEVAARSFVLLLHNRADLLPLDATKAAKVAVLGGAAKDARILGGGSAVVFPAEVISPLDGLRQAFPDVTYELGADPRHAAASVGRQRRSPLDRARRQRCRGGDRAAGARRDPLDRRGAARRRPEAGAVGGDRRHVHAVETGKQTFGFIGLGQVRLTVGDTVLFEDSNMPAGDDPFTAILNPQEHRFDIDLRRGNRSR